MPLRKARLSAGAWVNTRYHTKMSVGQEMRVAASHPSPRLKKSLEKAVTPAPEEASGCYLEWLEPPRVASKQL